MASSARKRKEQKKAQRRKRLDKERNQRANRARFRYRLDVKFEGEWKTVRRFKTTAEVQAHLDETEAIRRRGDTEIIEGRVVDLNSVSGKVVATVAPFMPEVGPSMEQAARDVLNAAEGVVGWTGPQGGRAVALGINKENFKVPVGKPERPAVCGRKIESAANGGESSLTSE